MKTTIAADGPSRSASRGSRWLAPAATQDGVVLLGIITDISGQ